MENVRKKHVMKEGSLIFSSSAWSAARTVPDARMIVAIVSNAQAQLMSWDFLIATVLKATKILVKAVNVQMINFAHEVNSN